jgi:capsular exopolysaccharide synthesis family protein
MKDLVEVARTRAPDDVVQTPEQFLSPTREVATAAALRRRWRLVASVVTTCFLLAYLFLELMTPLYSAITSVMIDPREPKRPTLSADPTAAIPPSEEIVRKNEIAIIRSRNLAEAVVARLSLDHDPEFNPALRSTSALQDVLARSKSVLTNLTALLWNPREHEGMAFGSPEEPARERTIDAFLDRLRTTTTDASRVIEIRFLSENPEQAARIANAVADQYVSQKPDQQIVAALSSARLLERDIEGLNRNISESERKMEEMRNEHGLLPSANVKAVIEQLSELNKQLAVASGERVRAEGRLAELQSVRGSRGADSAASVLGSPLIQRLQAEAALLAARVGEMSTTYGESHPKIAQARAELKDLDARIDAEVAKINDSYRKALAVARANEMSLRREVDQLKAQVAKANTFEVDVRALDRRSEADRTLLTQQVARLSEAKAQINLLGPEARVISKATVPRSPSFPPKLAIMAAVLLLSATGGTILAVMLERRDESIDSIAQIRQLTSARILGAIPIVKRARKDWLSPASHVLTEPRSLFVESLRAVWLQIDRSRPGPGKVLLITSSVSGEGKSCIAACLARMLALAGHRIVIVDADLRRPTVSRAFGMEKSPGLAEFLAGGKELDDVLQMDGASGTYFIAAGTSIRAPADILQSPRLSQILRELSASFDSVIIDAPPVLAVSDASILAEQANMTMVVVRWRTTKTRTFITALQRMADLGIPVNGTVLSMVDSKKYGLYGYPDAEIFSRDFGKYYSS